MISKKVHDELMSVRRVLHYLPVSPLTEYGWTPQERQLFWAALDRFPRGPWPSIAECIGTKSTRQAMTHAQKLRQKLKRWVTRLHRNPTARSLLDGVAPVVSAATEISVAVWTPRSLAMAPATPSGHGHSSVMKQSPSPRPNMYQGGDGVCVILDDKHEGIHSRQNEDFAAKSCSNSITVQVQSTQTGPVVSGNSGYASANLRMLFEPPAATPRSALPAIAPTDSEEAKQEEDNAASYPIYEAEMPERNLLDELVGALWNDQSN